MASCQYTLIPNLCEPIVFTFNAFHQGKMKEAGNLSHLPKCILCTRRNRHAIMRVRAFRRTCRPCTLALHFLLPFWAFRVFRRGKKIAEELAWSFHSKKQASAEGGGGIYRESWRRPRLRRLRSIWWMGAKDWWNDAARGVTAPRPRFKQEWLGLESG